MDALVLGVVRAALACGSEAALVRAAAVLRGADHEAADAAASAPAVPAGPAPSVRELPPHVMVSFHCASSTEAALALRAALTARGLRVWCCTADLRVGSAYRSEIARNAALCGVLIPLVSRGWAASSECEFEFNIALRTSLVTKSRGGERPRILPLVLPDAAPLFGDIVALAERFPCLVGIASNTNVKFLAQAGEGEGKGAGADAAAACAGEFAAIAEEAAALLGVRNTDSGDSTTSSGSSGGGGGNHAVPFDAARHVVLRSSLLPPNYEGFFTDFRKIKSKEVGARWVWSTSLIISVDGTLFGAGRDESSTSELAGRIDEASGTFVFTKTCFAPNKRSWRIFYAGAVFDSGDGNVSLRGRWSFDDVPFESMSPLCSMALWAISH